MNKESLFTKLSDNLQSTEDNKSPENIGVNEELYEHFWEII